MAKYLIILIPMILLLASCASNKNLLSKFSYESLMRGNLNIDNEEQIVVLIESKKDWQEFQENLQQSDKWQNLKIDFQKEIILLLIDEQKSDPAYKTFISKINETEKEIEVYWETERIESDMMPMVMSSPYHIYKIPKTEKQLVIK